MCNYKRIFVTVLDSLGIGALPDADKFGDEGADTLDHILDQMGESRTKIIEELGEEEIRTGAMIVYTSADSVLQICGTEETFDLENLYRCCRIAREITMRDEWRVGRVIARPYVGKKKGEFKRTSNRHDYALKPTSPTVLNALKDAGFDVISVGKINDIFSGEGITEAHHSDSSVHGMEQTIEQIKAYKPETNNVSSGQVLQSPYDFEKAKLAVKEMTDLMVLDLVDKGLITLQGAFSNKKLRELGYPTFTEFYLKICENSRFVTQMSNFLYRQKYNKIQR